MAEQSPQRQIAGWPAARVALALLLLAALIWAAWTTRTLLELKERRIVSVSLARLIEDFVASEARNGTDTQSAAQRTQVYLAAVNRAVGRLAKPGTVVIVSEATLARSVPDRTEQVRRHVEAELRHGVR